MPAFKRQKYCVAANLSVRVFAHAYKFCPYSLKRKLFFVCIICAVRYWRSEKLYRISNLQERLIKKICDRGINNLIRNNITDQDDDRRCERDLTAIVSSKTPAVHRLSSIIRISVNH